MKLCSNEILILGDFGLVGKAWVEILKVGKVADFMSHVAFPHLTSFLSFPSFCTL